MLKFMNIKSINSNHHKFNYRKCNQFKNSMLEILQQGTLRNRYFIFSPYRINETTNEFGTLNKFGIKQNI